MGAIVSFGRKRAFLRDGVWRSADAALERRLNEATKQWVLETGGPSMKSADPEMDAALEIARLAGGHLILHVPADAGRAQRTWFAHRQYTLNWS